MTKKLVATYGIFRAYRNEPTSIEFVLSEFIDNSIASYSCNNSKSSFDGLTIRIDIIESNSNGMYSQKIIITDNAYGMSEGGLCEAMQPGETAGKTTTSINQYGVGMKLAIFWLAESVDIYTKNYTGNEYELHMDLTKHNPSEEVYVESKESKNNKIKTSHGTCIEISQVVQHITSITQITQIKDALGCRYKDILCNKNSNFSGLELLINFRENIEMVEPANIIPNNIKNFFHCANKLIPKDDKFIPLTDIKEFFNFLAKNEIECFNQNKIEECVETINKITISDELKKYCNNSDIRNDFLSGKDMWYTFHWDKYDIDVTWGMLDYSYKKKGQLDKYNGVCLSHSNRTIRQYPNDTKHRDANVSLNTFKFDDRSLSGGATYRKWLCGSIDLTKIIEPDKNKRDFLWKKNPQIQDELATLLQKISDEFKNMANVIIEFENNVLKTEIKNNKSTNDKIDKVNLATYPSLQRIPEESPKYDEDIRMDNEENPIAYEYSGVQFYIKCESKPVTDFFGVYPIKDKIMISLNTEHPFWKKALEKGPDVKAYNIYPLAICMALCNEVWNGNSANDFLKDMYQNIKRTDTFAELINKIFDKFTKK